MGQFMFLHKEIKIISFCLILLLGSGSAYAGPSTELNSLQDVLVENKADGLRVRLSFQRPVMHRHEPVFYKKSARMDFPNAHINPEKRYFPVSNFIVSQIYASQFDPETIRIRFMLDERDPDLQKKFKWEVKGRFIDIKIMNRADSQIDKLMARVKSHASKEKMATTKACRPVPTTEALKPKELSAETAAITAPRNQAANVNGSSLIAEKKPGTLTVPDKTIDRVKLLDERDSIFDKKNSGSITGAKGISKPVFADTMNLRSSSVKMFYMLLIVLGMMFSALYLFKRFVWKGNLFAGTEKAVNVLSTGYLGPKKSIALVEVAGEVLVLGIANDNISLLSNIKDEEKIERIKNSDNSKPVRSSVAQKCDSYRSTKNSAVGEKKNFSDHLQEYSGAEKENKYSGSDVAMMIRKNLQKMGAAS